MFAVGRDHVAAALRKAVHGRSSGAPPTLAGRYRGPMPRFRRPAPADLPALYRVCLQTGAAGADASSTYADPDLLGHLWCAPHAITDPALCEVVDDESGVAGYLVATADTPRFEAWCAQSWWPPLQSRYPLEQARPAADQELVRSIHSPETTPAAITGPFPAHLHINLLPRLQGQGAGGMLIARLLDRLRSRGVAGVHLGVDAANTHAIGFYEHQGFTRVAVEDDGGIIMGLRLT